MHIISTVDLQDHSANSAYGAEEAHMLLLNYMLHGSTNTCDFLRVFASLAVFVTGSVCRARRSAALVCAPAPVRASTLPCEPAAKVLLDHRHGCMLTHIHSGKG